MADVQFNPMDAAFVADPYPTYHRLRAEDPVHHSPLGFWVMTRYPDVMAMLRDPRLTKEPIAAFVAARFGMAVPPPGLGLSMLDRDPPDHTRLRGLVSKAFTPKALESLRPGIQQIVDDLLADVAGKGQMDLIEEFAYPLPVRVICEMLGVPVKDHERFKAWGLDIARGLDAIMLPPDSEVGQRSVAGRRGLAEYFRELIAERRAAPRDDMLSALIVAEEAGDKLNEEELLATCILLLVAGHETTVNLIGNSVHALLTHPDQLALLRAEPDRLASAIEELLRYAPPVQLSLPYLTTEPIQLGTTTIPAGQIVVAGLLAANRDPTWITAPTQLDITRTAPHHLTFGHGIHHCFGAPLARLEGRIALHALLSRFPRLRLAVPSNQVRWAPGMIINGLTALPVALR